jgi:hypothetical protein
MMAAAVAQSLLHTAARWCFIPRNMRCAGLRSGVTMMEKRTDGAKPVVFLTVVSILISHRIDVSTAGGTGCVLR